MKKITFLAICIATVLLSGCTANAPTKEDPSLSSKPAGSYKITFRQEGKMDVTRRVKEGETLTDIPTPVQKDGYTTVWDRTEFSALTEDVVVLAVATANEYVISFDLTSVWGEVQFDDSAQTVTFDSAYSLSDEEPSLYGFFFTGWEIKGKGTAFEEKGTYQVADDITLVPTWEKDEESRRWWGPLV